MRIEETRATVDANVVHVRVVMADVLSPARDHALTAETIFPSARALLLAGISCRQVGGKGWAVYWMEGGSELTLFPGDEGPQEASSVDEIIEWIGGDQPCTLTPASLRRFGVSVPSGRNKK